MSLAVALSRSRSALHLAGIQATMRAPAVCGAPVRWLSAPAIDSVVSITELKGLIASPEAKLHLFDVREPSEYADGKIANAVNIPGTPPLYHRDNADQWHSRGVWRRAEAGPGGVPKDVRHQQAG